MRQDANIVCLLTPPGVGAIATVRLHGAGVGDFAAKHLSRAPRLGKCVLADLIDEQIIDDVVAVLVDEHTLDLSLHGGAFVVQRMMTLAERCGFTRIDWRDLDPEGDDEFDRKLTRLLPLAMTTEAIAILLAQPGAWRELLQRNDADAIARAHADRSLHHLLHPPTVAIVGVPNAGKSTLANQLFARERSITADLPGTTRDWVGEHANLDGLIVTLVDTPGVRETDDPIEREAIARARGVIERAHATVVVLDATQPFASQACLTGQIVVINKVDRAPAWDAARLPDAIRVCATTGAGVDELRRRIRAEFGCEDLASRHARGWV